MLEDIAMQSAQSESLKTPCSLDLQYSLLFTLIRDNMHLIVRGVRGGWSDSEDGKEEVNEILEQLKPWLISQEKCIEQAVSEEEKTLLYKEVLKEMNSIILLNHIFNNSVPNTSLTLIKKILHQSFALLGNLVSEEYKQQIKNTVKQILEIYKETHEQISISDFFTLEIEEYCIESIVTNKLNNLELSQGSFHEYLTFKTKDIDLSFLNTLFNWQIEKLNDEDHGIRLTCKATVPGFFIAFTEKNESFLLPNIIIGFNYSPYPDRIFRMFLNLLKENNIAYKNHSDSQLELLAISNKKELASIVHLINKIAFIKPDELLKLDEFIGFMDPWDKIMQLTQSEKYDEAISTAQIAEKKGFNNYLWLLAEKLQSEEVHIYDKAIDTYDLIEKNNPYYKDAKLRCLDILTLVLNENLTEDERIKYVEHQVSILLELSKEDSKFQNQLDKLYSYLCGEGLSNIIVNINDDIQTLFTLAKRLRESKSLLASKEKKSDSRPESLLVSNCLFKNDIIIQPQTVINADDICNNLYNLFDCNILSIQCNSEFLQVKLKNSIPKQLLAVLSSYKEVYLNPNNYNFCMTDKKEILNFAEILNKLVFSHQITIEMK